ncbi:PH domain-containing protein [Bacillus sp. EB01]|uniref:PH domain-containing protein n=1 Tax=Bacillus sp. EB01 TaxID=1347086 RepID=UPI0005C75980|nr:PH domain-containing protein [Bacillus sp. EB01]
MIFSSKRDVWMGTLVWIVIAGITMLFYQSIFSEFDSLGLIISLCMISLLLSIWFHTRYKLGDETLKIYYGPFKKTIRIQEINWIRHTTHLFTAPALSIRRIEIQYRKYGTVTISPLEEQQFLDELKKRNPTIGIKDY